MQMAQMNSDNIFMRNTANNFMIALALLLPCGAKAAEANPIALPEPTIKEKGPHHRVWETVRAVEVGDRTILKTNSYTELQSGLFRWDADLNDYVETDPRIEPFQDGAVVRRLQYSVIFAPNLASPGALDLLLPSGERLTGQLMSLAFTEGSNSVMIAETKDCFGEIGPDGTSLTFRDAFTD